MSKFKKIDFNSLEDVKSEITKMVESGLLPNKNLFITFTGGRDNHSEFELELIEKAFNEIK
jgi:hypothetical protein